MQTCPECGKGTLVDITFTEGAEDDAGESIQEPRSRQVETYSCGHEIVGPRLDEISSAEESGEVERRTSEETVDPAPIRRPPR